MQRIGIAGLLFAGVTLFGGCDPKEPIHNQEAIRSLAITAALKGYDYCETGDTRYNLSNAVWQIMSESFSR